MGWKEHICWTTFNLLLVSSNSAPLWTCKIHTEFNFTRLMGFSKKSIISIQFPIGFDFKAFQILWWPGDFSQAVIKWWSWKYWNITIFGKKKIWIHFRDTWQSNLRPNCRYWYHIETATKWLTLCRRHFHMHFLELKVLYFYSNFTEVHSQGFQ